MAAVPRRDSTMPKRVERRLNGPDCVDRFGLGPFSEHPRTPILRKRSQKPEELCIDGDLASLRWTGAMAYGKAEARWHGACDLSHNGQHWRGLVWATDTYG